MQKNTKLVTNLVTQKITAKQSHSSSEVEAESFTTRKVLHGLHLAVPLNNPQTSTTSHYA